MNPTLEKNMRQALAQAESLGRLRQLRPLQALPAGRIDRDGRTFINFSSNDYLGLSQHPTLMGRAADWALHYGIGATASRHVCGTLDLHSQVEDKIAKLKGTECALIFNSGYQANEAVLAALLSKEVAGAEPLAFCDKLNHASMHEGLKAAGVKQIRFRHNDMEHLGQLLDKHRDSEATKVIITESVFSMDGDRADLAGLGDLASQHQAFTYVDEAHATGVLGPGGRGLTVNNHPGKIDIAMGTFGKALGSFGAYIACSELVRDYLVNRCAGLIYTTALPPQVLGAMDAALDLLPDLQSERDKVAQHAEKLRQALTAIGYNCLESSTQIVPVVMGSEEDTLKAARYLEDKGLLVIAIRPPTVPQGSSRLRIALSAAHSTADIDRLIDALKAYKTQA